MPAAKPSFFLLLTGDECWIFTVSLFSQEDFRFFLSLARGCVCVWGGVPSQAGD